MRHRPVPSPAVARLDLPFGAPPPLVHCPRCGQATCEDDEIARFPDPCPHVAFIHAAEIGEFVHMSPDFARRLDALAERDPDLERGDLSPCVPLDELPDVLARLGYGRAMLVLEVTNGGPGCGPGWTTESFGFRFDD